MIAIYTRKSVEKEGSKSIKEQKLRGIDLAKKLGLKYKVYVDEGISGTWEIDKRPEFSLMLDDIDDGLISSVYAYHQDRIERNPQTRYFFNELLRKNDVKLYTDNGEVDLNNDEQEMLGDMMSVMSKYYVRTTKRRVKNTVARNIAEGKIHGIIPYGYMRGENKMMVVNPDEAKVVKMIFKLSLEGEGFVNIAKELTKIGIPTRYKTLTESGIIATNTYEVKNIYTGEVVVKEKGSAPWAQASVRGILYNPVYKGDRKHLDKYHHVPELIIVDPTQWDRVNRRLKANEKPRGKDSSYKYILNGMLTCGKCGKRLTGRVVGKASIANYHAYRCVDKRQKQGHRCHNRDILGRPLEEIIWNRLFIEGRLLEGVKEYLTHNKNHEEMDVLNKKLAAEKVALKRNEGNLEYIQDLIFEGEIKREQIQSRLSRAEVDISDCKIKIEQIKESLSYEKDKIAREDDAERDLDTIKANIPFDDKQRIIRKYIKDISVLFENRMYVIVVRYHLNIPLEYYTIDTKYNLAIEGYSNIIMPISKKYKEKYKIDPKLTGDDILFRLMYRQFRIGGQIHYRHVEN